MLNVLTVPLTMTGCDPEDRRVSLAIESHTFSVRVPSDWEHIDYGRKHTFRIDRANISFEDLGPVGRLALIHDVEEARRLWRNGQTDEARIRLDRLPVHATHLPDSRQYQSIVDAITVVLHSMEKPGPAYGEAAFRELLARLSTVTDPAIGELLEEGLEAWDYDMQRDIAWRQTTKIDGRPALILQTWDRLSHLYPKKHALLLNDGRLLSLDTEFGTFGDQQGEFDQLLGTLVFNEAPEESPPLRSR